MTTTDIERLLRQPAPDEPSMLPALVLPRAEPGGLRDRSLETSLGLRRVPWTMRIAIAAMLLAAIMVGALISGALRQLDPPLLRAGEFTGQGVALTYPHDWKRVTPETAIEDGSSVALVVSSHEIDDCSADRLGTLTPDPGSLAPDGMTYLDDQYGKVYGLGDRIYQCVIGRPMHPGEIRVVLTSSAPQLIQIGPFGDFEEPFYADQSIGGWTEVVPSAETGWTETIGEMPARLAVSDHSVIPGADEVRTWLIASPGWQGSMWHVQAVIAGPDLPALRAQADEVARSLVFASLPAPLVAAERDAAVTKAVDALDREQRRMSQSRLTGCLPRTPGEVTAVVTEGPDGPLRAPAEVTCTTTVEATEVRQWRIRLVVSWPALDGRPAGRWGWELYVTPDGANGSTSRMFPDEESASFPGAWTEPLPAGPAPDLEPGALVRVVGSQLQNGVLNVPFTEGGPSQTHNFIDGMPGKLLVVVDGPVSDDGLEWYRFDNGQELGWGVPWAGGRPLVEVVEPDCPAAQEPSVEDLVFLSSLVRRRCYGDRGLTFAPSQYARRDNVEGDMPRHEPAWLATDVPFFALFGAGGAAGMDDGLPAVLAPGVEAPARTAWVTARGHFNDPAAATCRWHYPAEWGMEQLPPEAQQRRCAETFVITSFEPADAP